MPFTGSNLGKAIEFDSGICPSSANCDHRVIEAAGGFRSRP
jgi:hypothetical protein